MEVKVVLPQTASAQGALAAQIAAAHAEIAERLAAELACPTAQKKQLIEAVLAASRREGRSAKRSKG